MESITAFHVVTQVPIGSILEESKIMETNYDGHAVYLTLTMLNMCEMAIGLGLSVTYMDWSWAGSAAHMVHASFITLSSLWVWLMYHDGTQIQTNKISALGTPYGPQEPFLTEFYDSTYLLKYYMYGCNWIVVGLFIFDIFAEQDETPSYWLSFILWFFDDDYASFTLDAETKKIFRIVVAIMKSAVYLVNVICLAVFDTNLEEWYAAAKVRAKREKQIRKTVPKPVIDPEEVDMNSVIIDGFPEFELDDMGSEMVDMSSPMDLTEVMGYENSDDVLEDPDNEFTSSFQI